MEGRNSEPVGSISICSGIRMGIAGVVESAVILRDRGRSRTGVLPPPVTSTAKTLDGVEPMAGSTRFTGERASRTVMTERRRYVVLPLAAIGSLPVNVGEVGV